MNERLIFVTWATDEGDDDAPSSIVRIPARLIQEGDFRYSDPVADYLSDKYGYLVSDWQTIE